MGYSDKAKLMAKIESEYREWGEDYDAYQILGDIEDFPVEDVAPVKHGRWDVDDACAGVCSACGEYAFETSTHHISGWFPRYCPNCGAKMDEVDE